MQTALVPHEYIQVKSRENMHRCFYSPVNTSNWQIDQALDLCFSYRKQSSHIHVRRYILQQPYFRQLVL